MVFGTSDCSDNSSDSDSSDSSNSDSDGTDDIDEILEQKFKKLDPAVVLGKANALDEYSSDDAIIDAIRATMHCEHLTNARAIKAIAKNTDLTVNFLLVAFLTSFKPWYFPPCSISAVTDLTTSSINFFICSAAEKILSFCSAVSASGLGTVEKSSFVCSIKNLF